MLCCADVLHYNDTPNVTLVYSQRPNYPSNDGLQINLCSGAPGPQLQYNTLPKLSTAGRWRPSCRPAHSTMPASQPASQPASHTARPPLSAWLVSSTMHRQRTSLNTLAQMQHFCV